MVEFDLRQLVYKDLQLTGATIVPPGTMRRLVSLIEQGLLKPLLAQTFPLEDLGQAQEKFMLKQRLLMARHVGREEYLAALTEFKTYFPQDPAWVLILLLRIC